MHCPLLLPHTNLKLKPTKDRTVKIQIYRVLNMFLLLVTEAANFKENSGCIV